MTSFGQANLGTGRERAWSEGKGSYGGVTEGETGYHTHTHTHTTDLGDRRDRLVDSDSLIS